MGQLVTQQFELTPPQQDSMLAVIERAVTSPDFDVNKLQQLLEMRERWEANEAKKAFVSAMNAFKANPPTIKKTKGVSLQKNADPSYFYAPLNQVCAIIVPALNAVGITHHWETSVDGEKIVVTCVLRHQLGHTECGAILKAAPDTGPGRNAIQSHGSTLTYLQRYTLLAACGLAATDNTDDDGNGGGGADPNWLNEQLAEIGRCETEQGLVIAFQSAAKHALEASDMNAYNALKRAKNARKKELEAK